MLVIRAGSVTSTCRATDNDIWRTAALDGSNIAGLGRRMANKALLLIVCMTVVQTVAMLVNMIMLILMTVIVPLPSVRVSMTTEDKEADQVGEEAGAANSKDKLGVADLRGLDKTSQRLKDNRDAQGDQEDGIEEGSKDFSSHPLTIKLANMVCWYTDRCGDMERTPKVNSSVVSFWAATTAHKPITREIISLSLTRREEY